MVVSGIIIGMSCWWLKGPPITQMYTHHYVMWGVIEGELDHIRLCILMCKCFQATRYHNVHRYIFSCYYFG